MSLSALLVPPSACPAVTSLESGVEELERGIFVELGHQAHVVEELLNVVRSALCKSMKSMKLVRRKSIKEHTRKTDQTRRDKEQDLTIMMCEVRMSK